MKKIFLVLMSCFAVGLVTNSTGLAAKKSAKKITNKRPSFKVQKTKGGLEHISLRQLAYLPANKRAAYLKSMDEAMVSMEKIQTQFTRYYKLKTAYLPGEKDVYAAFFFGDYSFAQGQAHNRSERDACIYCYNLTTYQQSGNAERRRPFECQPPPSCSLGRGGEGIRCNPLISGLHGRAGCFPKSNSIRSTALAMQRRVSLSNESRRENNALRERAEEFFKMVQGMDSAVSNADRAALASPEARRMLQQLLDESYDYGVMGDLFVYTELYNRAGVPMPALQIDGNSVQLQGNDSLFSVRRDGQALTLRFFSAHREYCNTPLDRATIDAISSGRDRRRVTQGSEAYRRETDRIERLREVQQRGGTPKVFNVLQAPECENVQAVINNIGRAFQETYVGLPSVPQAPGTEYDAEVRSLECPTAADADDPSQMLYQDSAVCTICSTERAVITNEGNGDRNFNHVTSRKWSTLLATMALACGRGTYGGRDKGYSLSVPEMQHMLETFGHCSADTYNWNDNDATFRGRNSRHGNIGEWAQNSQRDTNGINRPYKPDVDNAFENVYGISYDKAIDHFCEANDNRAEARSEIVDFADNDLSASTSPAATALGNCIRESAARAERLYKAGANNCIASGPATNANAFGRMMNETRSGQSQGLILHAGTDCAVAKQTEVVDAEGSKAFDSQSQQQGTREFATFTSPSRLTNNEVMAIPTALIGPGTPQNLRNAAYSSKPKVYCEIPQPNAQGQRQAASINECNINPADRNRWNVTYRTTCGPDNANQRYNRSRRNRDRNRGNN